MSAFCLNCTLTLGWEKLELSAYEDIILDSGFLCFRYLLRAQNLPSSVYFGVSGKITKIFRIYFHALTRHTPYDFLPNPGYWLMIFWSQRDANCFLSFYFKASRTFLEVYQISFGFNDSSLFRRDSWAARFRDDRFSDSLHRSERKFESI